jgi:mannosyltransferase
VTRVAAPVGTSANATGAPAASRSSSGTLLSVGAVTLLAAIVRIPTLGLQSYDFDESYTLRVVGGSFAHMLHGVASSESSPPAYYLLAWLWRDVVDSGEFGFRLLPAIAGVALVPVVYELGRTLGSSRVAMIAAAIVATSPYLVFYSQEARAYSLFALLSTLGLLFCVRAIQTPTNTAFALWAAVSLAAIATHYFAFFPFAGQIAAFLLFRTPARRVAAWGGLVVIAAIPLLLLAHHQSRQGHVDWIGAASLTQRVRVTIETFALGATFKGSLSHRLLLLFLIAALTIGFGILVAVVWLLRRANAAERRSAELVAVSAGVAIAIPFVAALGPTDYFIHKNLIPVLPEVALLIALGLGCARAGRLGFVAATCIVLSGLGLTVMSFAAPSLRRPDVRQVSDKLGAPTLDRVIVLVPRWQTILEQYQPNLQALPPSGREVSEIDVFTTSPDLPPGTVPPGFRLAASSHGRTFNLYRFKSAGPSIARPGELGQRTFTESGLQPIALFQPRADARA